MVTVTNCTAALFFYYYYNFCSFSPDNTSDYSTAEQIPATWEMTPRIVESLGEL